MAPQGIPGYVISSSAGHLSGIGNRWKGPMLSGQVAPLSSQPLAPAPAGIFVIQSTASVTNQVVTTSATGLSHAAFIYIPVTTATLTGADAPGWTGCGVPLVWNDNNKMLMVYSTGSASWMSLVATTSMSAGGFTTSF